ncbi:MAG: lipase family protein [Gordonia sp. (in: high G+C Gram-positive bacteria)]|jgi:pimeloyl-ACP methyl ester carboxylesterase|nr:lipase family protein [Gordonia sp. (in: high G+C Gram-positive bacteria)]
MIRAAACVVAGALVVSLAGAGSADASPAVLTERVVTDPVVALSAAASTTVIRYRSTSVRGRPTTMSATVLLPRSKPPKTGWPLAVWSHMTVGGADKCAPSAARRGDSELPHMTSGDQVVGKLLTAGFAVVRPDFEGIGSPGPHPYLIGSSLATSVIDAAMAVAAFDRRIGHEVVVAGHSEGAVASLFAAAQPASRWGSLRLKAVAAVTPPTRMGTIVDTVAQSPVGGGPIADLTGLAALLVSGASAADPEFEQLARDGGLSRRALTLMRHIDDRCYGGLTADDSFGGMAPSAMLGPRGARLKSELVRIVEANDVARLRLPVGLPVRIDAGYVDPVAPYPLVAELVDTYRSRRSPVAFVGHPAGHTPVPTSERAAQSIAAWLVRRGG